MTELSASALESEVKTIVVGYVVIDLIPPIHIRVGVGVFSGLECLDFSGVVALCESVVPKRCVESFCIESRVCKFRGAPLGPEAVLVVRPDLEPAFLCSSCGDENNSIRSAYPVECGCSGVGEYFNALYFVRCQQTEVSRETIDEYERCLAVNAQRAVVYGRVAVAGIDIQSCNLSEHGASDIDVRIVLQHLPSRSRHPHALRLSHFRLHLFCHSRLGRSRSGEQQDRRKHRYHIFIFHKHISVIRSCF